mgnify:CR=1 FL=1
MEQSDVKHVFETKTDRLGPDQYNYDRFTREIAVVDAKRTLYSKGIGPGCPAPDFELEDTDGNLVRLSDLRGKPVVLRFGNIS